MREKQKTKPDKGSSGSAAPKGANLPDAEDYGYRDRRVIPFAIGGTLTASGFKKKANTWYLDNPETIVIVNVQKSSYGPKYYLNVAVWLKRLGKAHVPKEHKCHIRCRWNSLIPMDEKQLERLMDLGDTSLSDEKRIAEIATLMQKYVLPFLSKSTSLEGLRSIYETHSWPSCLVDRKAQELLS